MVKSMFDFDRTEEHYAAGLAVLSLRAPVSRLPQRTLLPFEGAC